jgi:two-component system NarL family sensor kinase
VATTGTIRRGVTWSILGGSLAAGLLFVLARAFLPSDGARAPFYSNAWTAQGVAIAPIDTPAAGLLSGDIVSAIGDSSTDAWVKVATDPTAPRPSPDAPITYELIRDGSPMSTSISWTMPPIGATLVAGWGVILFSIATAGVAAFVFRRRPDEPAATALVLLAAAASGSSVPWFLGVTTSDIVQGWPFVLHAIVTGPLYMLLWPAAIHLALVFPSRTAGLAMRPWGILGIYAVVLVTYAVLTLGAMASAPTALEAVGTWPATQVLVVVPSLLAALAILVRRYLRTHDRAQRDQMRLATAGAVASAGLGLVLFMGPALLLGHPLVPDGAIGLVALPLPLGIAAGILHDRLFDIDAALNRTLVYGGLTLGVLATYAIAVAGFGAVVGGGAGFGVSLLATGVAALVALPLRDALQRAVNRLMYGMRDEPWVATRLLGQRLEWAADPEGALPAIAATIRDAFRVPYVAVEIDRGLGAPVIASETGARPAEVIAVPLTHGAARVGRLVLGRRSGERDFRPDERRLLDDLARQAGTAVAALVLRRDLARSRERLVVAREEERRRLRRDLHDGLGPALAAIGMRAETAAALVRSDADAAEANLEALSTEVAVALADVRRLVEGLRPPALDELGLLGAIRQQAERLESVGADTGAPRIVVDGPAADTMPELPAAVEVAAYRITVEALTNAVRHASAAICSVRIHAGDRLDIEVADDGIGLADDARPGVGLESMRVRAAEVGGELRVERRPPRGTRVIASLPIRGDGPSGILA